MIQMAVALVSLLAIVGSGSFAAKMLVARKARWLGIVIALAGYWFTFSTLNSVLGPREGSETVGAILFAWGSALIVGLGVSAALSLGLRKMLPSSPQG